MWSTFGDIRCINPSQKTKDLFSQLGVPVRWYQPIKYDNPVQERFESHMAIFREAYQQGLDNVLIFGGDVELSSVKDFTGRMKLAVNFMRKEPWDLFYLGCTPQMLSPFQRVQGYNTVYKVHTRGLYACVVSRSFISKIMHTQFYGQSMDDMAMGSDNAYAILPTLFKQKNTVKTLTDSKVVANIVITVSTGFVILLVLYLFNPHNRLVWLVLLAMVMILVLLFLD